MEPTHNAGQTAQVSRDAIQQAAAGQALSNQPTDAEPETAPRGSVSSWPRSIANADGRPSLFSAFPSAGQQGRTVRPPMSSSVILGGEAEAARDCDTSWVPKTVFHQDPGAVVLLLCHMARRPAELVQVAKLFCAHALAVCGCSTEAGKRELVHDAHSSCRHRQRSRQPPSRGFPASRRKPWSSVQPQLPCHRPPHGPEQLGMGPRSGRHCCRRSRLQGRGLSRAVGRSWARTGCPACPRLPSGWPSSSAL